MASAVRLSAAIMVHPSRRDRADALRNRYPELAFRLALDPMPDGPPAAIRAARVAWASADPDATHHLVVQDDAVLCESFADRVREAVAERPRDALCLFTEWGSDTSYTARLAALCARPFAEVVDHYVPTVALVLPLELAHDFEAAGPADGLDDVAMRGFLRDRGVRAVVVVPNLVDHDHAGSLVGNDDMGLRRSVCYPPLPRASNRPTGLTTTDAVPVLSTLDYCRPRCLLRSTSPGEWRRGSPFDLARRHGHDVADVKDLGHRSIGQYIEGLPEPYPYAYFSLWLTAFGLGLLTAKAESPHRRPVDAVLAEPAVARALDTMPAGAFRGHVVATGPGFEESLGTVIRAGVRDGYQAA